MDNLALQRKQLIAHKYDLMARFEQLASEAPPGIDCNWSYSQMINLIDARVTDINAQSSCDHTAGLITMRQEGESTTDGPSEYHCSACDAAFRTPSLH